MTEKPVCPFCGAKEIATGAFDCWTGAIKLEPGKYHRGRMCYETELARLRLLIGRVVPVVEEMAKVTKCSVGEGFLHLPERVKKQAQALLEELLEAGKVILSYGVNGADSGRQSRRQENEG